MHQSLLTVLRNVIFQLLVLLVLVFSANKSFSQCSLTSNYKLYSIDAPSSGCNLGSALQVQFKLQDLGNVAVGSVNVQLYIDGVLKTTASVATSVLTCPSLSAVQTFPGTYSFAPRIAPYKVLAKISTADATAADDTLTIFVKSDFLSVGGSISGGTTICSGGNANLTLSGHTGSVLKWQSSTDGFSSVINNIANTTTSLNTGSLTQTTQFRAVVQSGVCASVNSSVTTVTVDPTSVGGSIAGSSTVCSGTNSTNLTLSGHTGTIQNWESSTDGGSTWNNIVNSTNTYTASNLATTTLYRAIVKSGVCSSLNSSNATVSVDQVSVGGGVGGSATVCSGSNSGTLTLSGHTGSIVRWELSTDGGSSWSNIANTSVNQSYSNLTTTTHYRAVVQNGVCSQLNSSSAIITVNTVSVGGSVSGSAALCNGSNSGTLILSGHSGNILNWESSTDGGSTWSNIVNSSVNQPYSNLTVPTLYHAIIKNGVCSSISSSSASLTIDPVSVGGSVSGSATVCSGSNSGTLNLSGEMGSVVRWESSADGGSTWTNITNTTNSQPYTNVSANTLYRAIVKSGVCSSTNSSSASLTIDPVSVGGTVSGNATVCSGSNSGVVTLSGQTGNVLNWEFSTDGGSTWTSIANTTISQPYTNITSTTRYRAVVKSGVCSSANSSSAIITVDVPSIGGTVSSSTTVCSGSNSGALTLSGQTGNVLRWESSVDGGSTWSNISNTTTAQSYTNLTSTTQYRAVVVNGTCTSANSAVATVSVDPVSIGGTVSGSTSVCIGSNSGSVTLSGHTGSVIRWELSTDGGTSWSNIANTTTTQNYLNLTSTTQYRAVVQSGTCSAVNSGSATITITSTTVGGSVANNGTVCSGSNTGTLTLSGQTGSVLRWESSTDGGSTWITISNTTTSQNYNNITVTTQYRALVQSCSPQYSSVATITVDPISVGGTVSGSTTVCSGSNSGTLTLSGQTGNILRWEFSTDGGATWVSITNTTTTHNFLNITVNTMYRAVVQNGVCSSANSIAASITVDPISIGGSVSSNSTVCSGSNSGTLTLSGQTGNVLNWESSIDGGSTWNSIANVTLTQNYTNLSTTTRFRSVVKNGTCSSANSASAIITVDPASAGGAIAGTTSVCSNSNSGILNLGGQTGNVVRWESSTDGGSTWSNIVNSTSSQSYSNLIVTTQYRAVVQNGVCSSVNSIPATVTVDPISVGGSISGSATVCNGSNSGTLTLSGHTGSVVRWELSIDGGVSWSSIANTTTSQNYINLTTTTVYRAVIQSGACPPVNSGTATIIIGGATIGGTVSGNTSACSGSNSGTLTLSGHTGNVLKWQSSTDGGSIWSDIANTTITQSYLNLIVPTMYRAVVQSCAPANSSPATISIDPISVGGSLSGNTNVCVSSNTGSLTLSGHTGSIIRWESSTDGGVTWSNIVNTTITQSYNNLTATTQYRAIVQSGSCSSANSSQGTITVNPLSVGGNISGSTTACSGANSGTLTLNGNTGNVVRWELSIDGGVSWSNIANTTTTQMYNNLTNTTVYRAVVQSGACAQVNSATATITMGASTVGGSVSGSATVCSGSNSGTLTLSGHTGSVVKWQSSIDGGSTWADIVNTTTSQTYLNLTTATLYRAVVQTCTSVNSTPATISISPVSVGGLIAGSTNVCVSANNGTLTLSGHTGNILRWESSIDGGSTWTSISNTTTSLSFTNLVTTTQYRALVQSGSCPSANSATATITVDPVTVGGSVSGSAAVCSGANSGTLTLSGHTGNIIRWELSIDGGTSWSNIANTGTTQSYNNLTNTTVYRAVIQSGACSQATSGTATITIGASPVGGSVSGTATVCSGSNSGTLTLSGETGNVVKWQFSIDGGSTWTDIANTSNAQNYLNLTTATLYRAVVQTCTAANSSPATISISPVSIGGTISGSTNVCITSNSGALTLSGNIGNVIRWESSTDGGTTWSSISNNTTVLNYINLAVSTQYRAVVQSGSCSPANSSIATITVDPISAGGSIAGSATVCAGANSGTLTLTGHTGTVIRWESSIDGGVSWSNIANTTTTHNFNNLILTTIYRAVIQSGACSSANSLIATVTMGVAPVGGVVTGSATVCSGSNSGILTLSGHTGSVAKWQSSIDGGSTWSDIINTTTTQSYLNLTTPTKYRAVVQICIAANSSSATISLDPVSVGGSIAGSTNVCNGSNNGVLTLSGHTGAILNWEESTDGGITWSNIVNTGNNFNYVNITTTTMFRAVVKSGSCSIARSSIAAVTVDVVSVGGSVSSDATVCSGANSGTLNLSGHTGNISRWELSTDGGTSWANISNTTASQNYNNLTTTSIYRAIVQSGVCPSINSGVATITMGAAAVGGIVSSSSTACSGSNSGTLTLSGYTGTIMKWQSSIDNGANWSDIINNTTTQNYLNLFSPTMFRAVVQICAPANSSSAIISIDPVSVGGSVIGSTSVCENSNNGTLTLSGHTGAISNWEQSTDGGLTWSNLVNTSTTYNYSNLNTSTLYRAIVKSGSCPVTPSQIANVKVDKVSVGGSLSGGSSACSGFNSGVLTLSGESGSILRWELSTDGGSSWSSISNSTAVQAYNNLTTTTVYRAIVQNGTCSSSNSATATIQVSLQTVGGLISGSSNVCATSNAGTLSLSGNVGNILRWENSLDGINWLPSSIPNTTNSYSYSNLQSTTMYRAVVQSCALDYSSVATIAVDPTTVGGSLSGNAVVCAGSNNGVISLTGKTGNILRWEFSENNGITWIPIFDNSSSLNFNNLEKNTLFRAVIQSGVCSASASTEAAITIAQPASVASVAGSDIVCPDVNSGIISLENYAGNVELWQSSKDNGISWDTIYNISPILNYSNLDQTTLYRAKLKNGNCSSAISPTAEIKVMEKPDADFSIPSLVKAGEAAVFTNKSSIANGFIAQSFWNFGDGRSEVINNPVHTYADDGKYKVLLIAVSDKGCKDSSLVELEVKQGEEFLISNLVTLNQNGSNDTWYIENIGQYPQSEVHIYNRFGNEVYSAKPYLNTWDGTYKGKQLPDGTYYYVLKLGESEKLYKGTITILR